MTNRDAEPENVQRALANQQVEDILDVIVLDYAVPIDNSRELAQDVARRYAIAQRDYWDNNSSEEDSQTLRQIWTDALVLAATENDWYTLKQAIEFDIVNLRDRPSPVAHERASALLNLTKFL